jgi:hypothetical protein
MVEQVARGRLKVAAVAALGLATVGASAPANAAGKSTTMQIRVRVVESCQIRIDNRLGRPLQLCGGPGAIPPIATIPKITFDLPPLPPLPRIEWPASRLAASSLKRVRFVTFTY